VDNPDYLELVLHDGTPIIVRTLIDGDRPHLAEAYRRLTPEARYQRFWTHTGAVAGNGMLDRILHQDPDAHLTWAVLDPSREFSPLGAASWWRETQRPAEVEISFLVLDEEQGRGIGTLLLAIIWLTAFRADAESMVGHVLTENRQAARWLHDCGGKGEWDGYKISYRWKLEDLKALPQTRAASDLSQWLAQLAPEILG
jgi:GNAT superfamily N-acetyltransferase